MGIITVGTNDRKEVLRKMIRIKKIKSLFQASEIPSQSKIPILQYETPDTASLYNISFEPIVELQSPTTFSPSLRIDLLWQFSVLFSTVDKQPQWNRFTQTHQQKNSHSDKSEIFMFPIINMNSSDETWIYSTLVFIQVFDHFRRNI